MTTFKDYNHLLIQLKEKTIMKKVIVAVAACALFFACTPGDKNNGAELSLTESTVPAGAVDLGMVTYGDDKTKYNLYWAASNLSENGLCPNPEDYGDYYAWGETEASIFYDWTNYKWGYGTHFSKYNTVSNRGTVDNKWILEPEDDVAHVKLGGNWRMPTRVEWKELLTSSTCTWTTVNDVNGLKVTGPNGNSIFLPAAGYRYKWSDPEGGSVGLYWSSTLHTQFPDHSYCIIFNSTETDEGWFYDFRFKGFSIRPVCPVSE